MLDGGEQPSGRRLTLEGQNPDDRADPVLQKLIHAGWQTDESGYRVIVRVDGQGKWSQAIKPKNGPTLSWCVALAARP